MHAGPCPDPFVLRHRGVYWCYCTGFWPDGRCFGILRSPDLVHWTPLAGALSPLPGDLTCYWAPEVAYLEGRFFLYYSVGVETTMEIRVAVADHPAGPFVDSGRRLTREPFAIDPHPFVDRDGGRYLFYATDFLDRPRVGTGTVCDRLLDPLTLAGDPWPVTLPAHPWQIYDPRREEKGGVCWHTVEGPCVLRRKGLYYQMFSGGNWRRPTYGVGYAVSDRLRPDGEWRQVTDGDAEPPILRSVPGEVVGPGHNCAVLGPDGRQLYCVYHRWSEAVGERVLCIDPLDWAGERLLVLGPSTETRPGPNPATLRAGWEDAQGPLAAPWRGRDGSWEAADRELRHRGVGEGRAGLATPPRCRLEVSLRCPAGDVSAGVAVVDRAGVDLVRLTIGGDGAARLRWTADAGEEGVDTALGARLPADGWRLLRLDLDERRASVGLVDEGAPRSGTLARPAAGVDLLARGAGPAFSALAVTAGWEDRFEDDGAPSDLGWLGEGGDWRLAGGELRAAAPQARAQRRKGPVTGDYELVVNLRAATAGGATRCGVLPAATAEGRGLELALERAATAWRLVARADPGGEPRELAAGLDGERPQHLRLRRRGDRLELGLGGRDLGSLPITGGPAWVGLFVERGAAAFEMVRWTALEGPER